MSSISSNLRLLSSNPLLKFPALLFSNSKPSFRLSPLSYSNPRYGKGARGGEGRGRGRGRGRGGRGGGGGGFVHQRRGNSTVRELEMEEKKEGLAGFNKRRAEGKDGGGKRKNLQLKTHKLNPINTICYVQILGTGMDTQDTSPSVLLFFDKQRFIFNAGEGLQRFCTEHKIKLSKIDHIFLTRVCSETAGGLPGLLLTLAGIGEEGMSVNMWGPSDLDFLVDAMKSFIPNAAMVHSHSFGELPNDGRVVSSPELRKITDPIVLIDDEVVRLSAVLLRPSQSADLELRPGDIAVVYACELPEIKGKFDPDKAKSLGLKPGPKYRELQLGNSVMSDHLNVMVHPSDVLGPSLPGPIVLLVDCPTTQHMPQLFSLQSLRCYYVGSSNNPWEGFKYVNCIIHMGPASVTKCADYQKWMKKFGSAQHIMAGHEIKNMETPILKASAGISSRLNYLCPQLFPAPGFWSLQNIHNFQSSVSCEDPPSTLCNSISAENLLKFHLRPLAQLGPDLSAIPTSHNYTQIVDELLLDIPEIVGASKHVSQFWTADSKIVMPPKDHNIIMVEEPYMNEASCSPSDENNIPLVNGNERKGDNQAYDIPPCLDNISREDMEIVLLGTGSSQPSKYRNVTSILVNLFSKGSILLDCGEGTLGQLKRRFGVEGADTVVKALRLIWISHIHADHHTGIARILALRSQLLKDVPHKPLLVIGPHPLKRFLDAYSRLEELDIQFLDCRHTTESSLDSCIDSSRKHIIVEPTLFAKGSKMQSVWRRPGSLVDTPTAQPVLMRVKEVLHEAGVEALYSVPVIHCPQAFGIVLKASERMNGVGKIIPGWKLVYSGDTRPCQSLIDASTDATVLIHEATFEEGMEDEAVAKNHSTTKEAIEVGTLAGAYRTILTHFSQRYPKIPVFDEAHMDRTCIAFDLMSVNAADLPVLPKVVPYLKVLFRNEMIVDESDDVVEVAMEQ